jgi:putative FmdB family regulatory protein
MPYYVYECLDCEKWTEVQASIGKAPKEVDCDGCSNKMQRSWKNLNVAGKVEGGTNGGFKIGR